MPFPEQAQAFGCMPFRLSDVLLHNLRLDRHRDEVTHRSWQSCGVCWV